MKRYITTLFCLISLVSSGQMVNVKEKASGYFGKRYLIGVSSTLGLSRDMQKATSGELSENHLTLNRDFSGFLYYTAKANMSVGLLIGKSATSFDAQHGLDRVYGTPILDEAGRAYTLQSIKGSPDIKDVTLGMDFRFFRSSKGAFSPLGQYYNIGIMAHQYTIDLYQMSYYAYNEKANTYTTLRNVQGVSKKVLPEIFVGAGVNRPVFNSLFLDIGIKMGLLMTGGGGEGYAYSELKNEMEARIYNRLRNREILNFNVGIAYPFK